MDKSKKHAHVSTIGEELAPNFRVNQNDSRNSQEDPIEDQAPKDWYFYTWSEKSVYILKSALKFLLFFAFLYVFLLSLNFMTIGFTLISPFALKHTEIIRFTLSNPFAALAIGIILTAIMQNATATTSIAVSMVGAGIIPDVKTAIPIIMGSNIGTCFTNSLIALTSANDSNEFRRAFSAATLNDMFNFLTTGFFLPIEIFSDFLLIASDRLTRVIPFENADRIAKANFIAHLLDPVTNLFLRLNVTAVNELTRGNARIENVSLACTSENNDCSYLARPLIDVIGERPTGSVVILLSIIILIICLFAIVKVLSMLISGPIAKCVSEAINASFPGRFRWLTHFILFTTALLLTLIVQSSNIITATLVPLCGIGIISLQRVYVMTLGSNIGTTVTGIISAFTLAPSAMQKGLQIAFVYTFFNTLGFLLWLPIKFLRFPKSLARKLGNIVFNYRWFLYVYIFGVYFVLPLIVFGLALIPNWIGLAILGIPILVVCFVRYTIQLVNKLNPQCLPERFRSEDLWIPIWFRSLKPYDEKINMYFLNKSDYYSIDRKSQIATDEGSLNFLTVARRISVINPLVREARLFKRNHTIENNFSDDECSDQEMMNSVNGSSDEKRENEFRKVNSCDF